MKDRNSPVDEGPVDKATLHYPPAPSGPVSNDDVIFRRHGFKHEGTVVGFGIGGQLVIRVPALDTNIRLPSDAVRLADRGRRPQRAIDAISGSQLVRATEDESSLLNDCLRRAIGNGFTVDAVLDELWTRGYEIYMVGGAVRDVLAGHMPKDVDLVGTMNVEQAHVIVTAMVSGVPDLTTLAERSGHLRIGRPGGAVDVVDYCAFNHSGRYTAQAIFDGSFERDAQQRDFCCNAVYYDWKNQIFIDPLNVGVEDARRKVLSQAWNSAYVNDYGVGKIAIRCIKLHARGFAPNDQLREYLFANAEQCWSAVPRVSLASYARRQLLSASVCFSDVENAVSDLGLETPFRSIVLPLLREGKGA